MQPTLSPAVSKLEGQTLQTYTEACTVVLFLVLLSLRTGNRSTAAGAVSGCHGRWYILIFMCSIPLFVVACVPHIAKEAKTPIVA